MEEGNDTITSYGKSNMHRMSMEAKNRNSIKYVMIIHYNKNDITKHIVVIAIFTSIIYIVQENIDFGGNIYFEGKFIKVTDTLR